jgi:hypothetical protein
MKLKKINILILMNPLNFYFNQFIIRIIILNKNIFLYKQSRKIYFYLILLYNIRFHQF